MSQRVQVFAWKFWEALGAVSLLAFAGALRCPLSEVQAGGQFAINFLDIILAVRA